MHGIEVMAIDIIDKCRFKNGWEGEEKQRMISHPHVLGGRVTQGGMMAMSSRSQCKLERRGSVQDLPFRVPFTKPGPDPDEGVGDVFRNALAAACAALTPPGLLFPDPEVEPDPFRPNNNALASLNVVRRLLRDRAGEMLVGLGLS